MNPLRLAYLHLLRRPFPTLITLVAIALSVACSGVLLRLYKLSESRFSSLGRGGDAIVGAKAGGIEILLGSLNAEGPYPDFLPYKLYESLKSEQTVRFEDGATMQASVLSVIPFVYFARYENLRIVGTDENFFKRPRTADNIALAQGRWAQAPGEVVLGSLVASEKNLTVGSVIKAQPWLGRLFSEADIELKVVGLFAPTKTMWDRLLYSNVEEAHFVFKQHEASLKELSIWGPQVLHYFLIDLQPMGYKALESLVNRRTVGQMIRVQEQKEHLQELTGLGRDVGLFVTALVILLSSLSVCAMLVTRFEAMTSQLAVLRAIGYSQKTIAWWLISEGFLLGATGVFIGALIDALSLPFLQVALQKALPPPELVSSSLFESAPIWLVALLGIILAIVIPLIRVYRQDIHRSLRGG